MTQPASSCPRCFRDGIVADVQDRDPRGNARGKALIKSLRFVCICGFEWITPRAEAEQHGKFLERMRQRVNP